MAENSKILTRAELDKLKYIAAKGVRMNIPQAQDMENCWPSSRTICCHSTILLLTWKTPLI